MTRDQNGYAIATPCRDHPEAKVRLQKNYRGFWECKCEACPSFCWGDTEEEAIRCWDRAQEKLRGGVFLTKR